MDNISSDQKCGIVTGASSGIGLAVAKALRQEGWLVIGIGRSFSPDALQCLGEGFIPVTGDICNLVWLQEQIAQLKKQYDIQLLVNNAGVAYYGMHEELNPKQLHEMVVTNFEVPMLLCRLLLRDLKQFQGTVVNISSVTATHASPRACAYGATKAALSAFSRSMFEENRKYGVRVVTVQPDMTGNTGLYRHADFQPGEQPEECLAPEEVAEAVLYAVNARKGLVMREITLQPQKNRIQKKD